MSSPFTGGGRGRARARTHRSPVHLGRSPDEGSSGSPPRIPPVGESVPTHELRGMNISEGQPTEPAAKSAVSEGTRASNRGLRRDRDDYDSYLLSTKPKDLVSKRGMKGDKIRCITNYFRLKKAPTWVLHEYHCEIKPALDSVPARKALLRTNPALGAYIFDGMKLYNSSKFETDPLVFQGTLSEGPFTVTIKYHSQIKVGDPTYMHFYHLILRRCMFGMGLEELGRNFYDKDAAIELPNQRLSLWPGFQTSLRQHEDDVLLCVETTHKVLRMETALEVINQIRSTARGDYKAAVDEAMNGVIVMTQYNKTTYRVSDVSWDANPLVTFDQKGTPITYADYYKQRYGITLKDLQQPLLFALPSKRDYHRGKKDSVIYLIPELCQMTGLSDRMRENFTLMKELAKYLHVGPQERVREINHFMQRLQAWMDKVPESDGRKATGERETLRQTLSKWGLSFETTLVPCEGRVLPKEKIQFGNDREEIPDDKEDWSKGFRNQKMLTTVKLERWAVIVPQRDAGGVENLTQSMIRVAGPLNMRIANPMAVVKLTDIKGNSYVKAINDLCLQHQDIQLLFVILPNNKPEPYGAVKRRLALDLGVVSQCFVAKNLGSKGLLSICTKVVIQMNAKLGGEPWTIKLPLKNMMVVGLDVYHGSKTSTTCVGAMVASISPTFARYYSATTVTTKKEFSVSVAMDFSKCLAVYKEENNQLPERIVIYRDGVGDGDLAYVYNTEVMEIKKAVENAYQSAGYTPKLSFIVVTKRINSRVIQDNNGRYDNPKPGTVVDDVITLPWRYDFYLVSATARQGTVSPCCYNVMYDDSGLEPDKMQMLTYKMCHMYFNWSGTVAVPAPCQYAHKLAFISGVSYMDPNASDGQKHRPVAPNLQKLLHFL